MVGLHLQSSLNTEFTDEKNWVFFGENEHLCELTKSEHNDAILCLT